jgi:hypothetical protein
MSLGAGAGSVALLAGIILTPSAALADDGREVVARRLDNPRQLAFAPDGALYVTEAGSGGTGPCQEHPELGELCFGLSGSVARVDRNGDVTRVVTGLPSVLSSASGEALGPGDIAFTGNHRFALTIGLASSPEFRAGFGTDAALLGTIVKGDLRDSKGAGSVNLAFDATQWEADNNPDGTDIDSNPVGIANSGNGWVYADAGANAVNSTRKGGTNLAVLDPVPTTQPGPLPGGLPPVGFPADAVPTDAVKGPDGAWYVSQLVGFPFEPGSSTIWRVVPGQAPVAWATGLTNVTSLAFAANGRLYAVELASDGLLGGSIGSLVRVRPGSDTHPTVAGGLTSPYGVAIRGKSAYVTTCSVCVDGGKVVRIGLSD